MNLPINNPYLPADKQDIDNIPDEEPNFPGRRIKTDRKPRSLVTGGAGFIGSHVAEELLNMGHEVVILDDLSGGFLRNVPQRTGHFVKGSITDVNLLQDLFNANEFDYVFHLAAYAAEGLSHFIRHFNYENNLVGSVNLINMAVKHNVKRFIFTSSIAVYGAGQNPMSEEMLPMPEDPYGISKFAVEMDLKAAYQMWGMEYTIFRPHNVYGERQHHGDPYRNVLGIFMNQIFQNKPITIFGDGLQTRAFSYIGDVAPYIARSCQMKETTNEIINVGADTPYTVLEIAEKIRDWLNPDAEIMFLPERNEVKHAYCNHEKFKSIFGDRTPHTLEYGISKMVGYVKEVGILEPIKFKGIEIWEKMPESWRRFTE